MTPVEHSAPSAQPRHALITGAGSGIGAAVAVALARAGCCVTLCGRTEATLHAQARQVRSVATGAKVAVVVMDVTDRASVAEAVRAAEARYGAIHVLVNNAGQARSAPFLRTDDTLWQDMIAANLTGTYLVTQAILPGMLAAAAGGMAGRIINIASTAGLMGYAYVSAYVAAKHGVIGLTRALALELARKNITVNAVCPGYTATGLVDEAVRNIVATTGQDAAAATAALVARNPQQRLVRPEEVAQTVLWLCASGSDALNGQAIAVDGGEAAG